MKINPLKEVTLTENFADIATVTQTMVRARAAELAVIKGRSGQDVTESDLAHTRRELTGQSDANPKEAMLESVSVG